MPNSCFQVNKDDFRQTRFVPQPDVQGAEEGELVLRVDRFAITSNNVTYAIYGTSFGYWNFYPAPDGWGILPCWGFAEVIASGCRPGIEVGERFYGFWPMASTVRLRPSRIEATHITEGAPHRQGLHPFYNEYFRHGVLSAEVESWQALFRVQAASGYALADFVVADDAWHSKRVVLASASSKTALATAYLLKQRRPDLELVGLTSDKNVAFTEGVGCYNRVLTYADVESLEVGPSVYIDFAGDAALTARVHYHLPLTKSILIGGTHWDQGGAAATLPGPAPELFFAPAYIGQLIADWGAATFQERFAQAWHDLMPVVKGGITLDSSEGEAAVEAAYRAMLDGTASPSEGRLFRI